MAFGFERAQKMRVATFDFERAQKMRVATFGFERAQKYVGASFGFARIQRCFAQMKKNARGVFNLAPAYKKRRQYERAVWYCYSE